MLQNFQSVEFSPREISLTFSSAKFIENFKKNTWKVKRDNKGSPQQYLRFLCLLFSSNKWNEAVYFEKIAVQWANACDKTCLTAKYNPS